MHDLVIRNGKVIDGTGRPAFRADLAINGDRIVAVGDLNESGLTTIDAEGRLVTPGFVDPHTHLDAQLFWDPLGTPACWNGTTSVILGNCGVSFAPVVAGDRQRLAETLESVEEVPGRSILASVPQTFESYGEYLDSLAAQPLGVNAAGLVGHAAMRFNAMGPSCVEPDRHPSEAEQNKMCATLDEAMSAGALGFSTSRTRSHLTPEGVPIPGTSAELDELMGLARVLKDRDKGLVQWVAGFGENDTSDAFPEVRKEVWRIAETARFSGRPVVFSMFTHELVPKVHSTVLDQTEIERAETADIRPMFNPRPVLSFFNLFSRAPIRSRAWKALYDLPPAERLAALHDPATAQSLIELSEDVETRAGQEFYLFGPEVCEYEIEPDRRLSVIAAKANERPSQTILRRLLETRGRQIFASVGSNQCHRFIEEVFDYPHTLMGLGDAGAHVGSICDSSLTTYLLTYWCRTRGRISLEEAVRRLTLEPAETFFLEGRGRLAPGYYADVNVIDFDALAIDLPEFAHDLPLGAGRWTQTTRGYDYTIVNGKVAVEAGRHTGRLAGSVLRA
ncbi:MAG: amidohydrolase family protein [bacterium]|nr:amidohydrolase family protein [bacterium]